MALVVIVEDEAPIADLLAAYLVREGFAVEIAADGVSGLQVVARRRPAVIVLDVGLPALDGLEVCRRLRAAGDWTPVLFLTARDDEIDRVVGLELGADDYVTKPFSPREVTARVRALVRRQGVLAGVTPVAGDAPDREHPLEWPPLVLDPAARRVLVAGREVGLTTTEFDLLAYLMRHPGRICPRDELLTHVWGYPAGTSTRTVDVHVAQVRAKLGDAVLLRTVRGIGYGAEPAASDAPTSAGA